MVKKVQCLIIGGGPSGLSLAYGLQGDTLILERDEAVGGLCRSITHEGGVFDIGGHSFHTPHPEVYEVVQHLTGGLDMQKRDARVYSHGALIPYPFQKYYDQIPNPDVVAECEDGLKNINPEAETANNFEEYILQKFGDGIAKHFMLPYNRKLWARDIKDISIEWTSERVAGAKNEKEQFDTSGGKRKPLQPDTQVGYPKQGGFEEIFKSFVPHVPNVTLNMEVESIDAERHLVTTKNGEQFEYEFLVSTVPVPYLVRMIQQTPAEIVHTADNLPFMSVDVVMLLVGRPLDTGIQRIYVANPEVPPHKIAMNHNSSDYLRNQPVHAIMAEVSYSATKPINHDTLVPETVEFLTSCGILNGMKDIVWSGHYDAHFAYPVYTHARPGMMQSIKDWLAPYDMYTLGRFGEWEYINSDKCVMKGLELAKVLREQYPIA